MAVETKNLTPTVVAGERPTTKMVVPKKSVKWSLFITIAVIVIILGSIIGGIVYMILTSNFAG